MIRKNKTLNWAQKTEKIVKIFSEADDRLDIINDKAITEAEHNAGLRYTGFYAAWARTAGMPRVTAKVSNYGLTVAGRSEASDEAAEGAQKAYFAAANALISAGMLAEWWVKRVCLEDHEAQNMGALRAGLGALVVHFR